MPTQEKVATLLCRAHLKVNFTGFVGGCIATTLGATHRLPEMDTIMEPPKLYGSRQSLRSWQQRNDVAPSGESQHICIYSRLADRVLFWNFVTPLWDGSCIYDPGKIQSNLFDRSQQKITQPRLTKMSDFIRHNFDYSMKNIPIPKSESYMKSLIHQTESFITRLRWRAIFFLQDDENTDSDEEETPTKET